ADCKSFATARSRGNTTSTTSTATSFSSRGRTRENTTPDATTLVPAGTVGEEGKRGQTAPTAGPYVLRFATPEERGVGKRGRGVLEAVAGAGAGAGEWERGSRGRTGNGAEPAPARQDPASLSSRGKTGNDANAYISFSTRKRGRGVFAADAATGEGTG
ncbi:hypothetical protein T484DRAFT_1903753, partial [Baffinella frigidus]